MYVYFWKTILITSDFIILTLNFNEVDWLVIMSIPFIQNGTQNFNKSQWN